MGLAASQARLLSLTARQHAIEYKAQKLEAEKLQLANESDQVYNTYLAALDATKVQYKVVANDGSTVFRDATFTNLATAGYLFNVNGTICKNFDEVKAALGTKTATNPNGQGIVDLTANDSYTLLSTLIAEGYVVLMEQKPDPEAGYEYNQATGKIKYTNPDNPATTQEYNFSDLIDDNKAVYKVFGDTSVSTSTKVQEISDEINLKKAEAQYEADMDKINRKDSRYDTQLSQLETERNAIKTEIETLKTVAKENVDRTFKLFG